jgi:DNA-binding transcriptional MerR regulator
MQRAGNRRYYRPADVDLVRRINRLLNEEGYTVRGVQKVLRDREPAENSGSTDFVAAVASAQQSAAAIAEHEEPIGVDVFRLIALRNRLADALER